jgi:hypothetical protein
MKTSTLGRFNFDFSYNQFLVYDVSVEVPECEWREAHFNQGFARRESTVCVGTILQYGQADATVFFGPFARQADYLRAIRIPFYSPTGKVIIRGMMELYVAHILFCPPGHYNLYVAQRITDEENDCEAIDLFFLQQEVSSSKSEIIIADDGLAPPPVLLETAAEFSG